VDRHVEDASHHGIITIPARATASGDFITVRVSNFGTHVAPALGNPGTYSHEETEVLFNGTDQRRIDSAPEELGYIAISEHLL
jgi:hypothetical protein